MNSEHNTDLLSPASKTEIDGWVAKYPPEQIRSALIPALHIAQDNHSGYLTNDLIEAVADYLGVPRIWAFEVATFYSMYELKPVGKYKLGVCSSVSCALRGSDLISNHLQHRLGINFGETTPDGRITLKHLECLGACKDAPVIQVNKDYHENMTCDQIDDLLETLL
jgi:NADH-quinone oxidoreductase subunit E